MKKYFRLLLLFCSSYISALGQITQDEYPNIVFCLADDWGWPHAGAYGDSIIKTPNFDRIAKEGMLFNHTYVTSPSCTPSRNSFISALNKINWQYFKNCKKELYSVVVLLVIRPSIIEYKPKI